ncbi:hypothetical protein P280DRAFT_509674 [Massarina eburnea CBS 473.64]|uniref:Uncharacterized protein n=1 Tax=Massarina eburnea CBS 473.64 TaxID=1395130 RepID=A0A6A6RPY7_9PLEO|nr:hypothetical protein P280DRAFT_509674 [Massarina eburnea CBS 473.64]
MLRYPAPADKADWESALPIGNGRLGAMIYGGVATEILRLNEESVWYGGPQNRTPQSAVFLPELRDLIRRKRHAEAEVLAKKRFLARPRSARHYEPLGQCFLEFEHAGEYKNYERCLDLENAEVNIRYELNGNVIRRSCIASFPHGVIAIRIQAEEIIAFSVALSRMSDKWYETNEFLESLAIRDGKISMCATPGGKNSNQAWLVAGVRCWDKDGGTEVVGRTLNVRSRDVVIILGARTLWNNKNGDPELEAAEDVEDALKISPEKLWGEHRKDWQCIYGRQKLQLWPEDKETYTEDRIKHGGIRDPGLIALYHAYGRYLLLSSSRNYPDALTPTLQGIWNPYFSPPWGSKYTLNINLQMNYWPVNTSNLSECSMPLFYLLHRLCSNGEKTARDMYGCGGWCCHHNTDIWADTDPQDEWMPATLWPLGGAWLCTHIWEQYEFDEDREFLEWMFPVLRGCVEFLLDFLVEDASGKWLVTNPSLSPENTFVEEDGKKGYFCEGSTLDIEIIRTVFEDFLKSVEVLHNGPDKVLPPVGTAFLARVEAAIRKLPPIRISPTHFGIQEWGLADYADFEPGHRHVSHLFSLYPGSTITPTSSPALAAASLQTLKARLEYGGGHTGWSRAWLISLFARLRRPEQCHENIQALLRDSTVPNMMDNHPPVQLDGNWGGCAGILECLVQSHEVVEMEERRVRLIRLLPACPKEWKNGKLKGAKAKGGFKIDFEWENGRIVEPVIINSTIGHEAMVCFHDCGMDELSYGVMTKVNGKGRHKVIR